MREDGHGLGLGMGFVDPGMAGGERTAPFGDTAGILMRLNGPPDREKSAGRR